MYRYYLNGFVFSNEKELNSFIRQIIKIGEKYIRFLIYKGKLFLPFELNSFDAAIDLLSELFKIENNCLVKFQRYFSNLDIKPKIEEDFLKYINTYIFSVIQNNLIDLYRVNDPYTYKIIRNLKEAIESNEYYITHLFSDKFIHRKEIDFNGEYLQRDDLLTLIQNYDISTGNENIPLFLSRIFEAIESQNIYIHAIAFNDLLYVYKQLLINEFKYFLQSKNISESDEADFQIKMILEDIKEQFNIKMRKYFVKTNFSDKLVKGMYNIIDDVIFSLISGCKRKSVKQLVEEYIIDENKDGYFNKVEYVLKLFNEELLKIIKQEKITI